MRKNRHRAGSTGLFLSETSFLTEGEALRIYRAETRRIKGELLLCQLALVAAIAAIFAGIYALTR